MSGLLRKLTRRDKSSQQDRLSQPGTSAKRMSWLSGSSGRAAPNKYDYTPPAPAAPPGPAPPPYEQPSLLAPDPARTTPAFAPPPTDSGASDRAPILPAPAKQIRRFEPGVKLTRQDVEGFDDPYAFLSSFDTVFLIDDSASMTGSSWRETHAVLQAIVPICTAHDSDGIDLYFMNHKTSEQKGSAGSGYRGINNLAQVDSIFDGVRPSRATPMGRRLQDILGPYLDLYTRQVKAGNGTECLKPLNIIVVTDGAATDEVESWIVQDARKLDGLEAPPYQVGIQFFQVGNMPDAAAFLEDLDDGLERYGIRDMVDTVRYDGTVTGRTTLTADFILKTVLGAVVKRLDRRATVQGT